MITLQTRNHAADPWRNVQSFAQVTPTMCERVLRSKLEARLVDLAKGEILAQSLPTLGVPVTDENIEDAVRLFG
ncbi:hypothetical protein [Pararhodobacter sp.]|uniref:hypothetical protein n=1 Tax=Pararhodobacter sp. TaxID=2127056 RepID=UPI002FDCC3C1